MQPKRGFGEGSYKEKEGQIVQRAGNQNFRGGTQNNWEEQELERDPNTMDIDRGRERNRTCFVCEKWNHMAKNCWQRKGKEGRIVEMLQELAKDNGRQ